MTSGRYGTDNSAVIHEWMARTADPERREAFLRWLSLVSLDPHELCHGFVLRGNRVVCVAHVPIARVRVLYIVFDTPARAIRFLELSDEGFDATQCTPVD